MLKHIPSSKDFRESSDQLFNLAWDRVAELSRMLNDAYDDDGRIAKTFWKAAQGKLKTSFILLQQGVEFALKARIRKKSPFLLVNLNRQDWPKGAQIQDVSFSEFKTIDANELIKVHNTFCENRLPPQFEQLFEQTKVQRNSLVHTVDKKIKIVEQDIYKKILEFYELLYGPARWIICRHIYLHHDTEKGALGWEEDASAQMWFEFDHVSSFLTDSEWKRHFGVSKKQRRYICPSCVWLGGDYLGDQKPSFGFIGAKDPNKLVCLLCGEETEIDRRACPEAGCKSNVIQKDGDVCLICFKP